ncbi:Zinc finger (C3HC4-type RING finger) family protein, partial [Zea mays]
CLTCRSNCYVTSCFLLTTRYYRIKLQVLKTRNSTRAVLQIRSKDPWFPPSIFSLLEPIKLLDDRADKKRAGFIVLISDGLDGQSKWGDESITPTDPIRGLLRKYPVHTFGLGKAHDPKALHYIADISYGIYSSIVTDNLDKIIEAFAVCLAGFKTVVAVDACVDIWSNSLLITRIDPGGYILRGSSGGILVGTLYAGEVKDFI